MGYSREVLEAAKLELERRRMSAESRAAALEEEACSRRPRIREIRQAMQQSAIQITRAVLDGGDIAAAIERIKTENLRLRDELAAELAAADLGIRSFEPAYACPHCGDSGYAGGRLCACYKRILKEEACRRISHAGMASLAQGGFDGLRLEYYPDAPAEPGALSPRRRMEGIVQFCRSYADDFGLQSPSLLLSGRTGTGKTHVSLAIANAAAERGFGVVYGPAQTLLHKLEREHFGREAGDSLELMTQCDLFVLDDLGAEFPSPFYKSCLYNLINARMLENRPTIISTNLDQEALSDRYDEAITSRIIGTYIPLYFVGSDIRQIKLKERMR